jgi:CubicO group peptidase (beta-lactamase class C family)
VDSGAIAAFVDATAVAELELHSLMIIKRGQVVAEGWWAPYTPEGLQLLYSLSKSFTATAIGLAQAEGLVSVEDLVLPLLEDFAPTAPPEHLRSTRLRDLLAMASGHREDMLAQLDPRDLVRSALAVPAEEPPGTWFTYNNGATLLLSAIVAQVTGHRMLDYLRPRLLEPLGIDAANWHGVGQVDQGFSGLHLGTEAVAKLGLLYSQGGVWEDRQLLPGSWVREATQAHIDNPREPEVDWRQGYGYQFWMSRHGYRGDGAYGQFCLVLPEQEAVVVTTGATERMQAVLDLAWEHLLPGLDAPGGAADDARLEARLTQLALPTVSGEAQRPASALSDGNAAAALGPASLSAGKIAVVSVEEAPDGWLLTLTDGSQLVPVRCGFRDWRATAVELPHNCLLELVASAAWTGPTTLEAEVIFVRTPHRLLVTVDEVAGSTLRWATAPLGAAGFVDLALDRARS